MRTPSGWTPPGQTSLQVLCACFALCGAPTAVLGAPEQITPTPAVSTPEAATEASTASSSAARADDVSFDWRLLSLLAMACLVGAIAGRASRRSPELRVRLFNKPKKTAPSVLVPPRPELPLIPRDSPNATRVHSVPDPVPRQTPASTTRSGIIDYLAPFGPRSGEQARSSRLPPGIGRQRGRGVR
jgi:hypothetical protein